jgi:predicted NBD/HSP70 family sugar kinase
VHSWFDELFEVPAERRLPIIGREVLGEVLARVSLSAPADTSRVEIAHGHGRRSADRMVLSPGTVSKAVKVLLDRDLLEIGTTHLQSSTGRAVEPLRLGSSWVVAGVKLEHHDLEPVSVTTVLITLNGAVLRRRKPKRLPRATAPDENVWPQIAQAIAKEILAIKAEEDADRAKSGRPAAKMLGVGVEVAAHVFDGDVVLAAYSPGSASVPLSQPLEELLPWPVVVENDVNALAVWATHSRRYEGTNMVLAAVFDQGVGGGLVMDGRLRRGGHGMAMEIGHLLVEPLTVAADQNRRTPRDPSEYGFSDPCWCKEYGHVDVVATPSRIRAELGVSSLAEVASAPCTGSDGNPTREYLIFERAGAGLGRGLADAITIVNPKELILRLPPELIGQSDDQAASAYLKAVKREISTVFSTGAADAELTIEALEDAAITGACAAAICVIDAFIEHARGLDDCPYLPVPQGREQTIQHDGLSSVS